MIEAGSWMNTQGRAPSSLSVPYKSGSWESGLTNSRTSGEIASPVPRSSVTAARNPRRYWMASVPPIPIPAPRRRDRPIPVTPSKTTRGRKGGFLGRRSQLSPGRRAAGRLVPCSGRRAWLLWWIVPGLGSTAQVPLHPQLKGSDSRADTHVQYSTGKGKSARPTKLVWPNNRTNMIAVLLVLRQNNWSFNLFLHHH
jgi:hypothetical protein